MSWFHAFLGHHASGVAATEGLALAAASEAAGPSSRRVADFVAAYAHWQGREGLAAPRPTGEEVLWVKTGLILALWSWRPT